MKAKRLYEDILSSPPKYWGRHPEFARKHRENECKIKRIMAGESEEDTWPLHFGEEVCISKFKNPLYPEVTLIPRSQNINTVDEWGDAIGIMETNFPFSSYNFYVDYFEERNPVFYELWHADAFFRLCGILQLQCLVPPRPDDWNGEKVSYLMPQFHHSRGLHSLITAILMEIVLARNGFSYQERIPMVIAAGCHDIATPAGGDSIMRLGSELDEEKNFIWTMKKNGLSKRWQKEFGFDLEKASQWINGKGVIGKLLDAVDKMAYTAIDCYYFGGMREGDVRKHCQKYPLVMDIWQDIRLTPNEQNVYFVNPDNLFNFLMLRAYEFRDLLLNPYSRALDFLLERLVRPLYEKEIITRKNLLTWEDKTLWSILQYNYPERDLWFLLEPEEMDWEAYETEQEMHNTVLKLGDRIDHTEHIKGFSSGLDWLVINKEGQLKPLKEAISKKKVKIIEEVVESTKGYYVYYYK